MRGENLHFLKTIFSSFSVYLYFIVSQQILDHVHISILVFFITREASEREPFSLHAYCLPRRKLHVVKLNLHEFILSRCCRSFVEGVSLSVIVWISTLNRIFFAFTRIITRKMIIAWHGKKRKNENNERQRRYWVDFLFLFHLNFLLARERERRAKNIFL